MSHYLTDGKWPSGAWPRVQVGNFARIMEHRLEKNEGKGHWVGESLNTLLGKARRRLAKVKATKRSELTGEQIGILADVANYIMMAVDNHEPPESEWDTRPDSEDELGNA